MFSIGNYLRDRAQSAANLMRVSVGVCCSSFCGFILGGTGMAVALKAAGETDFIAVGSGVLGGIGLSICSGVTMYYVVRTVARNRDENVARNESNGDEAILRQNDLLVEVVVELSDVKSQTRGILDNLNEGNDTFDAMNRELTLTTQKRELVVDNAQRGFDEAKVKYKQGKEKVNASRLRVAEVIEQVETDNASVEAPSFEEVMAISATARAVAQAR